MSVIFCAVVNLHPSDSNCVSAGFKNERLTGLKDAGKQGAGDDGAKSLHDKGAIEWEYARVDRDTR